MRLVRRLLVPQSAKFVCEGDAATLQSHLPYLLSRILMAHFSQSNEINFWSLGY